MEFAQVIVRMIQHHLAPFWFFSLKARGVVTEWSITNKKINQRIANISGYGALFSNCQIVFAIFRYCKKLSAIV